MSSAYAKEIELKQRGVLGKAGKSNEGLYVESRGRSSKRSGRGNSKGQSGRGRSKSQGSRAQSKPRANKDGKTACFIDVRYMPQMSRNLISYGMLEKSGCSFRGRLLKEK